jgi:TrmH family RNA methyltransferase
MASRLQPELSSVLEDVRRAATARGRRGIGAFVAEGQRLLARGFRAGWVPREVLLGSGADLDPLAREAEARGARTRRVPEDVLLELAEGRRSGLVTALFDVPRAQSIAELVGATSSPSSVFLVLVDVDEPGNVGALIRTALASGAAGVICAGSTDPFHPKAMRTSLGSTFKLPLGFSSGEALLDALRQNGIASLAAVARQGEPIDRASWPRGRLALCVGNEGSGLPERLRAEADVRVSIDLSPEADSFSVNAAAAVCLYEIQRRARLER